MTSVCGVCKTVVNSITPSIQCAGSCANFYHAKCVNISPDKLHILNGSEDVYWMCTTCRGRLNSSTGGPDVDVLKFMREVKAELISIQNNMEDFKKSVGFCSDKVTDFEAAMKTFSNQMKSMDSLKKENKDLQESVRLLNKKVADLEQSARAYNIEIHGYPEKKNENIYSIVDSIHETLNIPLSRDVVESAHRVKSFESGKPRNIVIKYVSLKSRNSVLAAAKARRNSSNGALIINEIPNARIYINEHLTPENKILFKKVRETARQRDYKYVWIRNGSILVRKDDDSSVKQISSEGQIVYM
ncbi:uncharacterized protein LOC123316497 [Coccinella septempunctata]|uniref:uncharacterized protein LOC123316497 n=1 Tax=Coccinella septempunctata TaxID=41139 RepID=UPI001D07AE2D|nr:uncharacterized protein LOC123316497 [Coccinella septempunctata]